MLEDEIQYIKQIRGCHLTAVGVMMGYATFDFCTHATQSAVLGLLFLGVLFLWSMFDFRRRKWDHKKKMFLFKIVEFCLMGIFYYESQDYYMILLCDLILFLNLLDLVFLIDITKKETRFLFLMVISIPFFQLGVILSFSQKEYLLLYKSVLLACSMVIIYEVIELLGQNITNSEKVISQLRRLANDTIKANLELSKQQEKVKKANEKLSIQKIQLEVAYDKINRAAAESNTLNMISKYISSSLEPRTLLELITEVLQNSLGLDTCAIYLLPDITANNTVIYKIRGNMSEDSIDLMGHQMIEGGFNIYIQSEKTYVDNHVSEGRYPFINGYELGSLIIVPLVENNIRYGALVCGKRECGYFNENVSFFENVTTQLLLAIHNASLYSKMQQMAVVDGLTGLFNRGQLNRFFDQSEKQENLTYSITEAMIDIDHFKYVNDSYGHLFGDVVLKGVAEQVGKHADLYGGQAYRYGGEEFVILFQDKKINQCYTYMAELQEKINQLTFVFEGQTVRVHISVGIASYPETCKSISELLNATDGAMYYSKEHGRNKISIDSVDVRKFTRQAKGDS